MAVEVGQPELVQATVPPAAVQGTAQAVAAHQLQLHLALPVAGLPVGRVILIRAPAVILPVVVVVALALRVPQLQTLPPEQVARAKHLLIFHLP